MSPLSEKVEREYTTRGGLRVRRAMIQMTEVDGAAAVRAIAGALDDARGVLLTSSYEYPGRYTRWDIGFAHPLLVVEGRGRNFRVAALAAAGRGLVERIGTALRSAPHVVEIDHVAFDVALNPSASATEAAFHGTVATPSGPIVEEQRTRQPTLLSVVRAIADLFHSPEDPHLGLYGAFGYDLAMQLEPIRLARPRPPDHRDLVLYLPDDIVVVDHARGTALRVRYQFEPDAAPPAARNASPKVTPRAAREPGPAVTSEEACEAGPAVTSDHEPGDYAAVVRRALDAFARGDLFEVTPSQTLSLPTRAKPSALFAELRRQNPAPYGFVVSLGEGQHLIGASPEMYVRVRGDRVETCPIAGTIARGRDADEDTAQIQKLLASRKDEAELTMCTDVDRNDKSRICHPGTVRVVGRRQIETYSRLFHTVDHVEGRLADGYDALDAFLSHMWAVTVTGAPKLAAMQFIEDHEKSPRAYYGGAVGRVAFDGNIDTGLVLRTIHLSNGVAKVRAGATLLFASDPDDEERETRLKASALLDAIATVTAPAVVSVATAPAARAVVPVVTAPAARVIVSARAALTPAAVPRVASARPAASGLEVLVVDHEDSFVHTLADYFRETGAKTTTLRAPAACERLRAHRCPDLVVLSPGPGTPADFRLDRTLALLVERAIPTFGVCLGLQGIVEYFGGKLGRLSVPMHGVASTVRVIEPGRILAELPATFTAGRYHSLFARRDCIPTTLRVTADSDDEIIMAVEHASLPIAAVQFHPESIMTLGGDHGRRIVTNVVERLAGSPRPREA